MNQSKLVAVIIIVFLAGCSVKVQPLNFFPETVSSSYNKLDANLRSTTVSAAGPKEATGDIDFGIGTRETWRDALQKAFDVMAIFDDYSKRNVSVTVTVLKFDAPGAGLNLTTDAEARYDIIDRESGKVIFSKTIANSSTVSAGYSFYYIQRARESVNRSVRENIQQFLDALTTSNF